MVLHKSKKRMIFAALAGLLALMSLSLWLVKTHRAESDRFDTYTQELFCREVSGNSISLHYTLKNPSAYGITEAAVSYGSLPTDPDLVSASYENALALLHDFDRGSLSKKQKQTYDVLEDSYQRGLALAPYLLYENPLAPLTGLQVQLPLLLSEYRFYTIGDIENYFSLLEQTPEYIQDVLSFLTARTNAGLTLTDTAVADVIQECEAFLQLGEENPLYDSFSERLSDIPSAKLSESDTAAYTKRNEALLAKFVFPAYQSLIEGLSGIQTSQPDSDAAQGLCSLPNGRLCYERMVAAETGSDRSITELVSLTRTQILLDLADMRAAMKSFDTSASPTSDLFAEHGTILEDSNPLSILTSLRSRIADDFPSAPSVDVQVKYVQSSMQDYTSPAFYMVPAIDNAQENIIYINQKHVSDDLSLFTMLAHEGYPGHLYQNVYYMNQDVPAIRHLLSYGGYTEGWATYCEMLSYYYAPVSKAEATLMQKNNSLILGLYALADVGIHYDGWTLSDTCSFFSEYGITDTDAVSEIYQIIVSDPANYLKYYVGYLEILELKKAAIEAWGDDFTQKRFHKLILDAGPAPFSLIEAQL